MKHFLITALLIAQITLSPYIFGQPTVMPEIERILEEGRKEIMLPDFLDMLGLDGKTYKNEGIVKDVADFSRTKNFPFQKISFQTTWFNFGFMTDARHRIMFSSVELLGVKADEKRQFKQIHENFQPFIEAHENLFEIKPDFEDKYMSPFENFRLVMSINFEEATTEKMLKMVQQKDVLALEKWLKSMNPVIQAYAVIGFDYLQRSDSKFKFSKKQEMWIAHIRNTNAQVAFLSEFDSRTYLSLTDALSESYLEKFWDAVKDSKYFK